METVAGIGYFIIRYIEKFKLDLGIGTGDDKPHPQIIFLPDNDPRYEATTEQIQKFEVDAQRNLDRLNGKFKLDICSSFQPEKEISTATTRLQEQVPSLVYGKIVVIRDTTNQHGGTYYDSTYLLEIINSVPSMVATNCEATLDLPDNTEIVGLWNKNDSPRISIGHPELLRLFSVLVFKSHEPDETTLRFFRWDIEAFLDTFEISYLENLNRELRVLIQCEKASYPTDTDVFSRTIQFIMNNAVEDKILAN
jgi:hypothetical protein